MSRINWSEHRAKNNRDNKKPVFIAMAVIFVVLMVGTKLEKAEGAVMAPLSSSQACQPVDGSNIVPTNAGKAVVWMQNPFDFPSEFSLFVNGKQRLTKTLEPFDKLGSVVSRLKPGDQLVLNGPADMSIRCDMPPKTKDFRAPVALDCTDNTMMVKFYNESGRASTFSFTVTHPTFSVPPKSFVVKSKKRYGFGGVVFPKGALVTFQVVDQSGARFFVLNAIKVGKPCLPGPSHRS